MRARRPVVLTIALSVLLGALTAVSAEDDDAPVLTKHWRTELFKKGVPFQIECESGSYLSGFEGRAGAWIDHLRLVCARWNVARGRLEAPVVSDDKQVGQSQGGEPVRTVCGTGSGIAGDFDEYYARDDDTYVLHTLEFHCVDATDSLRPRWRRFGSTSPVDWQPLPHAGCPEGYLATGIYGRAGHFIDRLFGFVCRRRPVPSPVAEAKPPYGSISETPTKWRTKGNVSDMIAGGGVSVDTKGAPPPPPVQMARVINDTDVYRRTATGTWVRFDNDPSHFLARDFTAPWLATQSGWLKLDLKNVDFVGGEGWVWGGDVELVPKP